METYNKFMEEGHLRINGSFSQKDIKDLYQKILCTREFNQSLFLSQEDYEKNPVHKGVNPKAGEYNLLEKLDDSFILESKEMKEALNAVLGDYEIKLKKIICGVPSSLMPEWVNQKVAKDPVPNLGAYVKPEYRDITYFYGIDYHQDYIDYQKSKVNFVTMYFYIHDVEEKDAPLQLLIPSHKLGFSIFPHQLKKDGEDYMYENNGETLMAENKSIYGPAGTCYMWHPYTLHGTNRVLGKSPRISLRYLIASKDRVFSDIPDEGTRVDLNEKGEALVAKNTIKGI